MKKLMLALCAMLALCSGNKMSAQGKYGADSVNCIKYLSYYSEYYKQKNYDDALPNWRKAYAVCPPSSRQTLLVEGTTLIRRLIDKNYKNEIYREALIDSLMTLHDQRVQYYPTYAVTALNNKGLDMARYIKNDNARLFKGYSEIVEANGSNTKPAIFINQFVSAIELFKVDELDIETVLSTYEKAQSLLDNSSDSQVTQVKEDLEKLFVSSRVASCDQLIELFTPKFESSPEDLDLATKIVKMLSNAEGCVDNDLYLNAVSTMHKLNPSSSSAYFLFKLNSARGNVADAVKFMEEAIASEESDALKDGEYSYELAVFCHKNGMAAKAAGAAKKAIELNPEFTGKAYFLLGNIWGSVSCGKGANEIERRAPYWVAVDYLNKAKAADESLAEDAGRLIASFRAYFPQKAEAFMYDVTDGQNYQVNCGGLSATTTVRTQN